MEQRTCRYAPSAAKASANVTDNDEDDDSIITVLATERSELRAGRTETADIPCPALYDTGELDDKSIPSIGRVEQGRMKNFSHPFSGPSRLYFRAGPIVLSALC